MQLVLPTGCLTRTSSPATTASASSLPSCPSTTVEPVAKECATTARRSVGRCRLGAGTTLFACAPAATRNLENFNGGKASFLRAPERTSHSLSWHFDTALPLFLWWFCLVSVERKFLGFYFIGYLADLGFQSSCGLCRTTRTCELIDWVWNMYYHSGYSQSGYCFFVTQIPNITLNKAVELFFYY